MSTTVTYIGNELELFQEAHNWKSYYGSFVKPLLKGRVLEVGAGIGATTLSLCDGTQDDWLCIEPDPRLEVAVRDKIESKALPGCVRSHLGTLADLPGQAADAIIYIDVIEHIEHDAAELSLASSHLRPGGHLVILVPAHQFLFSPFDQSIGHYRRYSRTLLRSIVPADLDIIRARYLDAAGLSASLVQKLMLRQSYPTRAQIRLWDRAIVPLSRLIDPLTGYNLGKSVLLIARKR